MTDILLALILIGVAACIVLLLRLSSRLIFDRDAVIEHLNEKVAALQEETATAKKRLAKYPSLFMKRRVYWPADPDAPDKATAYCPECWNNHHVLSPLTKGGNGSAGTCEKHSPPLRY